MGILKRWRQWLLPAAASLLVLLVGSLVSVSKLEEQDAFCISCHLMPEVTYYERTVAVAQADDTSLRPTDLASHHYQGETDFRCINCHRGDDSLDHRGQVLRLAMGDTLTYLSGQQDETVEKGGVTAVNPHQETWQSPDTYNQAPHILNAACLKCHLEAINQFSFDNHFHYKLPIANELQEQLEYPSTFSPADIEEFFTPVDTVLTCLDCHRAHVAGSTVSYYLDASQVVFPACVQCHLDADEGPVDLLR